MLAFILSQKNSEIYFKSQVIQVLVKCMQILKALFRASVSVGVNASNGMR